MTATKEQNLPEQIVKFVEKLSQLDAGDLARLKRNAGNRLTESNRAMGLFYNKVLPHNIGAWANEEWYFLVATLYPLEKEVKGPVPPNLGASLRQVWTERNGNGLDRRVERLLDADEQQLPFQLRQAVHFLTSNRGRVNWGQLLKDVLAWSHPEKYVQKRWARDYFGRQQSENNQ